MNIQELKLKSSEQLITQAEELGIENASTLRKQEILFAILKKLQKKKKLLEQVFYSYYKMGLDF
jgi:transcription termination factor Rho